MEERQQHQQQLQDAAFGVQTQHEAAIDETAALYNQVMASYTTAQHHLVGQPPPGQPGRDHLTCVRPPVPASRCATGRRAAKRTSKGRKTRSSAAASRNVWRR